MLFRSDLIMRTVQLLRTKPDAGMLRTFGCAAFVHTEHDARRKWDAKARRGIAIDHQGGVAALPLPHLRAALMGRYGRHGGLGPVGRDVPDEARDMLDIERRLSHMDEIGVDIQVLFPSLFLRPITTEPDVEFALTRSYNRWLAEIWKTSKDRLRWVAMAPMLSLVDPAKVRNPQIVCDCLREHALYNEVATLVSGQLASIRQAAVKREAAGRKDLPETTEPA